MNDLINAPAPAADSNDVALVAVPNFDAKGYAAAVFEPFRRQITKAKREAGKGEAYDITTGAGMGRAKELRAMFRDIRTGVENVRKDRKAPIIEAGKLLDARAAEIKADVEQFEDKYDREIKAEESRKEAEKQRKLELERERVEAIEKRIANIRNAPGRVASADSVTINQEINQWTILRLDPSDYQEYLEDALTAVNATLEQLETLLAAAQEREAEARRVAAEREELARLKAEQAERERVTAAEAAERARLAQQSAKIAENMALITNAPLRAVNCATAEEIANISEELLRMEFTEANFGGRLTEAQAAEKSVQMVLSSLHDAAVARENAAAEAAFAESQQRDAKPQPDITVPDYERSANGADASTTIDVPLVVEGQPVTMGVDLAAPGGDETANWLDGLPAVADLAQDTINAVPVRPDASDILVLLMTTYNADEPTVMGWLRELVTEQGL